jgi:hypothetical protein
MNKIDFTDVGESLHVALRKACDSTPTSIAFHAIELLNPKRWKEYLKKVLAEIEAEDEHRPIETRERLAQIVRRVSLADHDYIGNSPHAILHCAFELFSSEDWLGYVYYLAHALDLGG